MDQASFEGGNESLKYKAPKQPKAKGEGKPWSALMLEFTGFKNQPQLTMSCIRLCGRLCAAQNVLLYLKLTDV